MSQKRCIEDTIAELNEYLASRLGGLNRFWGLCSIVEVGEQRQNVENGSGEKTERIVAVDDRYDNLFFHRLEGPATVTRQRFHNRAVYRVSLACYCAEAETFDRLVNLMMFPALDGSQPDVVEYNLDALGVLRTMFLIEDPEKQEGFNMEKYIFTITYEITDFTSISCCN